ncbi:carboxymuconolactone decarboxylase family protein [Arenibacter certesii]|uniref:Carboxymuconolactone decarboxylase-like domain-containing protein n=1 Tax=Arenibacter certesii TaxID=228955 RepID=A0A918IYU5_9FLAO|nr:carboxymuconolactone decarboxylase family protein [Arenibacter certesii]GGW39402.1 hypothetical protein GCM10007383_25170 [Arenibacter certesii]
MTTFNVPTRDEVSSNNQAIFDNFKKEIGFVPNIYAAAAYSDSALDNYLPFEGAKSSLSNKEKEVVNIITSQLNDCKYCQAAHTVIGKSNGFTDKQILELRQGFFSSDKKFDALVKTTKQMNLNKGKVDDETLKTFFKAGYTKGTLVDIILAIKAIGVTNYLHNLTQVEIDFPLAPEL